MKQHRPQPRDCFAAALAAGVLACAAAVAVAQPVKKVLVIGVDGLRPDGIEAAKTPSIDWLIDNGSYNDDAQAEDLTFSGPNWSSILHGIHRDKHNVASNEYEANRLADWPDFLTRLEKHNEKWGTIRLVTWDAIRLHQPSKADVQILRDHKKENGDEAVTRELAQLLLGKHAEHKLDPDAIFYYLGDVDEAGHKHGFHPSMAGYLAAIERADGQIGVVLDAIKRRPDYANENWLILLTSDHGGSIDKSHGGNTPEKRTIPFIVSGPSAAKGKAFPQPRNVSVTKTVLAFMGVPIDPAWELDGYVVGLKPSAPPTPKLGENLIFNGDAEYDRGFDAAMPDQYITGWNDAGPDRMTVVRYGAPKGYPTDDSSPPRFGSNFFCGGKTQADSEITQLMDIGSMIAHDEGGRNAGGSSSLHFALSGHFGGFEAQNDRASLSARFLDADKQPLGSVTIGPVTNVQRGNKTALLERRATGEVPTGTRFIEIVLTAHHAEGENDGYADDLSLILTTPGVNVER